MAFKLVVLNLLLCLDIIGTTTVELFNKWKPNSGWEVKCSWTLFSNDSLQSVRLYNNDQQFMVYRPERDGQQRTQNFEINGNSMFLQCKETVDKGLLGACVLNIELYEPPKNDFNFSCEVSGEWPMFRIDKKDITVHNYVPPSDASMSIITLAGSKQLPGRVTLNCTSSGLPAPNLQWTIGIQKVPHDFSGSTWNLKTKLWDVWSLLSYTPSSENLEVICTPEVSIYERRVTGKAAMYSKANGLYGTFGSLITIFLFLIILRQP